MPVSGAGALRGPSSPEDGLRTGPEIDHRLGTPTPMSASSSPTRRWEMTTQEQDMMSRFRQDYLDLLDGRVAKIRRLVDGSQVEPAHVALLSLESSSTMLGLLELAAAVRRLRSALPHECDDELDRLLGDVAERAGRAYGQLHA